jgi:hypothetical protein
MRKWLTRCAVAAALILIVLLVLVLQTNAPLISVGKPLPAGKVKPQLVNAGDSAVLLAPDGSLWAWGGTVSSLRHILGWPAISQLPLRIGLDSDWTQVASGSDNTVALKNDGSLWAWGRNDNGQVGQGNFTNYYGTPTRIGTETNWTQICAGASHNLALKRDGSLWAWGANNFGQLGDSSTNNRSVPTMISTDRDWRMIVAGTGTSIALKSDGTIWSWGSGYVLPSNDLEPKQMASGTNWLAISAHAFTLLALKTDGTLWIKSVNVNRVASDHVSGAAGSFIQIGRDRDWAKVYATKVSLWAQKMDGSWWVCGLRQGGQLSVGTSIVVAPSPERLSFDFEPWAFAPGQGACLLLCKDGKLWTWGRRLGAEKPSAARQKLEAFLRPVVRRFPALVFLFQSGIDQKPFLLWELPPEVRRALGTGPKSSTNNLTAGHSSGTLHQ